MMRPCIVCLERNWKYLFEDETGRVLATCQYCGAEVSWLARKKSSRPVNPKKLKPVDLSDRYIPGGLPVDREGVAPWE